MKAIAECPNKKAPSHFSEPPSYKLIGGETRINPILLQEIENSVASTYGQFQTDSNLTTRRDSIDLR